MTVSIGAGPLPTGLQTLERQTGIELLFDHALVSGLESPAVQGNLTAEAALRELLAETELGARRAESGAWIVERPTAPPLARPDAVVPEILVVGQRTQNADIRRFENDVQPYTVVTKAEMLRAHRDNVDQFFTSRITANTQVVPTSTSQSGDTASEIDLRGLGSEATIVLIDGRRMPTIPVSFSSFRQSDLNPIPLHAIKRIEVLTGTAGGIYGFGALGGVVNVVLDRDSRGVDLHVTEGISSRGDGFRQAVEASFGHTSRDGATDFVMFAAHSQSNSVLVGDRDYEVRDRRRTLELVPGVYPNSSRNGNAVNVRSFLRFDPATGAFELNPDLIFKPDFGGGALATDSTFLPVGFSGGTAELIASLTQHAGQVNFSLTDDEAQTSLGPNPRSDALLVNLRHRFAARLEAYIDAVMLRSRGEFQGDSLHSGLATGHALLAPESPANPFTDYIDVEFPIEQFDEAGWKRLQSSRYTAGLVTELPFHWRGTVEIGTGALRRSADNFVLASIGASSLFLLGDPSDLDSNPLGDWDTFQRAITGNSLRVALSSSLRTQFRDQSLRLAGPVFNTAAGPATLTLLGEHRREYVPTYTEFSTNESDGMTTLSETSIVRRSSGTTSVYAELRLPLVDETASVPLLAGLELQLAIRRDDERDDIPTDGRDPDSERVRARFAGTAYTAGAKVSPTSWLMLRGSYATGEQPPLLSTLIELEPLMNYPSIGAPDPKRGGIDPGADGDLVLRFGGNADLRALRASTMSLGAVMMPSGEDGPRIAIDFSRIRRTRDVLSFLPADIFAHEDFWPDRVVRAPLTDGDRANGYTAGRVTAIDTRAMNGGVREVETFDLHADWPLMALGGRLQLYADATYHMHNVQKEPFEPDVHWAGYREGPLQWRANGGFDWSTERLTIGANLQYFGSSLVLSQGPRASTNDLVEQYQGSRSIPAQSYLDLHGTWRLPVLRFGPVDDLTLDLGISNVLDKAPPRESSFLYGGPGYSRYGDARQRRFELGLSTHF